MIDTADLQTFLANLEGGEVAVDLLKLGQGIHPSTGGKCDKKLLVLLAPEINYVYLYVC